jgi:hypothetical protein
VHRSVAIWRGDFDATTSLGVEEDAVKDLTGTQRASYGALFLAAYRGHPAEASRLISATISDATARGEGLGSLIANWATAILHNGLGHYTQASVAAMKAAEGHYGPFTALVLPELVEAAVRSGNVEPAADALRRLSATTIDGADWAAGIEARTRALLSNGPVAEQCYTEAVQRLGHTELRPELARAHLLCGEWLRRENRRVEARDHLRTAYEMFTTMGAEAFAERTRRELVATGEKVRKWEADTYHQLTRQEEHIARLARDGRSNTEIGA